jgi:CYTH domain-containing protein
LKRKADKMANNNNLEIERKFLIEYPNFNAVEYESKVEIFQAYLVRLSHEVERRIRSWSENGSTKYYYTEKKFLTGFTRQEVETEVSKSEYDSLALSIDNSIVTVEKTRYTIPSQGLTFEVDVYPFSKQYAIMEVELESETQEYNIPNGISVLREVTGISEYANIPLCTKKAFPTNSLPM